MPKVSGGGVLGKGVQLAKTESAFVLGDRGAMSTAAQHRQGISSMVQPTVCWPSRRTQEARSYVKRLAQETYGAGGRDASHSP